MIFNFSQFASLPSLCQSVSERISANGEISGWLVHNSVCSYWSPSLWPFSLFILASSLPTDCKAVPVVLALNWKSLIWNLLNWKLLERCTWSASNWRSMGVLLGGNFLVHKSRRTGITLRKVHKVEREHCDQFILTHALPLIYLPSLKNPQEVE